MREMKGATGHVLGGWQVKRFPDRAIGFAVLATGRDPNVLPGVRPVGREHQRRLEIYNALNHRNYGIPEARINSLAFGDEGATDGGIRRIVTGLRYEF
jgi:hypothetical protein